MGIEQIFIFTFGTFTTLILFCACRNYCKKRVREIREKIKNKKLQHILKRNNTVKPITETDENIDEETKDEIKNEIRIPQLITNEDNVQNIYGFKKWVLHNLVQQEHQTPMLQIIKHVKVLFGKEFNINKYFNNY